MTENTGWNDIRKAFKVLKDRDDVEISGTKVYFKPLTEHFDSILGITEPVDTESSEPSVDTNTEPSVDTNTEPEQRRSTRQR